MSQIFTVAVRFFAAIKPARIRQSAVLLAAGVATAALTQVVSAEPVACYLDPKAPLEQRVDDLLAG